MIDHQPYATPPVVRVVSDDGTERIWPWDEFFADEARCVARTGNGITHTPTVSTEDQLATVEAALKRLVDTLVEKQVIGYADVAAPVDEPSTGVFGWLKSLFGFKG